jgi:hypothetical protein
LIAKVTRSIAGKPLDETLEAALNRDMPQCSTLTDCRIVALITSGPHI